MVGGDLDSLACSIGLSRLKLSRCAKYFCRYLGLVELHNFVLESSRYYLVSPELAFPNNSLTVRGAAMKTTNQRVCSTNSSIRDPGVIVVIRKWGSFITL